MNTHTHTPGPWTFTETTGTELLIVAGHYPGPNHHQIASVTNPDFTCGPFPVDFANARLLAAAPELLAALRALVNGRVRISDKTNDMLSEHDSKVIAARTAIARAEGKANP